MGFSSLLTLSVLIGCTFAAPAEPIVLSRFASEQSPNPATELSRRAQAVNYNQNYVASGANVQYSPNQGSGTYSVNYNTQQDFVVGLGWNPGNSDPVTYSGSFSASSGVGILALYGWTTNPLIEYYVQEYYHGFTPTGTLKGTFTSDGGTYQIWQHQQTNQPSIVGTTTFQQYISVRQSQRTSGTITVANHFAAWASHGMTLGTQNYQVVAVESWSGSGSGTISVSKGTSSGGGGGGTGGGGSTTTTSSPATTSTAAAGGGGGGGGGGSCSALYGQCGGSGWAGPSCCSSGTCKFSNQWYSQCL